MGLHKYLSIKHFQRATVYRTCRDMPLENYLCYLETSDLRYFTKQHVYARDLDKAMDAFYGDMISITQNPTILRRFGKMHQVMKLRGKYNTVGLLITALYDYPAALGVEGFTELLTALEQWGYKINRKKEVFVQLEAIAARLPGLITKIELIEQEINTDDNKEQISARKQLITLARILELKHRIDPKEISVLDWINYQQEAKQISDERQQRNRISSKQGRD